MTSFVYDEFMEYTMSRMLFERRRWRLASADELAQGIVELLDAKREYSHVQNVAQYLLLWIEDEHPDVHDAVVLSLVRSDRPVCRRIVASAAPKFQHVSPENRRALEIAASSGDDVERGDVASAVARLYRDGLDAGVAKLFRSLATRASPFVAISIVGGLETATVLSRDAEWTVQDAALLSARLIVSDPSEYVALLFTATSPGGIAAGVSWLVQESGFADRVDRDALAHELVSRRDSTLDKAALHVARTLEDPARRAAIAEEVCQHMAGIAEQRVAGQRYLARHGRRSRCAKAHRGVSGRRVVEREAATRPPPVAGFAIRSCLAPAVTPYGKLRGTRSA